jgi:hypothetical protein
MQRSNVVADWAGHNLPSSAGADTISAASTMQPRLAEQARYERQPRLKRRMPMLRRVRTMASAMPATPDHVGLKSSRSHQSARARHHHVSARIRSKRKRSIVQVAVSLPDGLPGRVAARTAIAPATQGHPACARGLTLESETSACEPRSSRAALGPSAGSRQLLLVAAIMFEFDGLAYAVLTLSCLALLYSLSG